MVIKEINLNSPDQQTINIEAGKIYKINNCVFLYNLGLNEIRLFFIEPNSSGIPLKSEDMITNDGDKTIYITAKKETFIEVVG